MTLEETIQFINDPSLQMEGEVWKQHPVYVTYSASNFGRIKYHNSRQTEEKIKVQSMDKQVNRFGFCIHTAHKQKHFKSARFIAECFYGMNDDLQVDHINTIPYDNRIENLRFCSVTENNNNEITNTKRKKKGRNKHTEEIKQQQNVDIENEIWKQHPNIDIEVSNMGRVRWFMSRTSTVHITSGAYDGSEKRFLRIYNKKRRYLIHRLVADTFIPNTNGYKYIRHVDGNKLNNRVDNLEWTSLTEIMIHNKVNHKNTNKIASIDGNGNIVKIYECLGEASKDGYSKQCIRDCLTGKQHTHKGFRWIIMPK